MRPESISHLPTMPRFEPGTSDPGEIQKAHEAYEATYEAKQAAKKKQMDKSTLFAERFQKDAAFRFMVEAQRALARDLEKKMGEMEMDVDERTPLLVALYKSADDPAYAQKLLEHALFFAKERQVGNKKMDVWERVKKVSKADLIQGLKQALDLEHDLETEPLLEGKRQLDETEQRFEEEWRKKQAKNRAA